VLGLRHQSLGEDDLEAFSSRFGPLEEIPMGRMSDAAKARIRNRYVTQLSDMTYVDTPPPASVLLGVEIPAEGGDSCFADQSAAYHALPDSLALRILHLTIKHDAAHISIGKLRPGFEAFDDRLDAHGAR
jgi:taurine dioxygenase